jgi:hypothetical protein
MNQTDIAQQLRDLQKVFAKLNVQPNKKRRCWKESDIRLGVIRMLPCGCHTTT